MPLQQSKARKKKPIEYVNKIISDEGSTFRRCKEGDEKQYKVCYRNDLLPMYDDLDSETRIRYVPVIRIRLLFEMPDKFKEKLDDNDEKEDNNS